MTLHKALKAKGLAARKPGRLRDTDLREIYRIVGGKILGDFDATEAWELLRIL